MLMPFAEKAGNIIVKALQQLEKSQFHFSPIARPDWYINT
jgi:hypothetical protein